MQRTRAGDFDEKRNQLLLTAAHVFAVQGMDKASMSQIAAKAGVSKSLLYHYYPSKGALIFAIIHAHLEALDRALEAATDPALAPEEQLHKLVGTVLAAYRGADDQHKVQLNAGPVLSEAESARIREVERRIVGRFADLIGRVRPGLRDGGRPLLMPVTMSLFGMMNWASTWFRDGGPVSREDYARIATTLLLDGVQAVR